MQRRDRAVRRSLAGALVALATTAVGTATADIRYDVGPIPDEPLRDGETFQVELALSADAGDVLAGFAVSLRWDVTGYADLDLENFSQPPYVRIGDTLFAPAASPLGYQESAPGRPGAIYSFNQFTDDPAPLEAPARVVIGKATFRWVGGPGTTRIELGAFNPPHDATYDDFAPLTGNALQYGAIAVSGLSDQPCLIDLDAPEHDGRALQTRLSMKSSVPTVFTLWLFRDDELEPVWYADLPRLAPPLVFPISVPFDEPGDHFLVAGMVTDDGTWCADVEPVTVAP